MPASSTRAERPTNRNFSWRTLGELTSTVSPEITALFADQLQLRPLEAISCRDPIDLDAFRADYIARGRPVVLRGAAAEWPCVRKWSLEYLEERCGANAITLRDITNRGGTISSKESSISRYVDSIRANTNGGEYLAETPMLEAMPQLIGDLVPNPITGTRRESLSVMMGTRTYAPGHFHPDVEAVSTQIVGKRRFMLFPPQQSDCMYPRPWRDRLYNFSQVDFRHDNATIWPKTARLRGFDVILEPGDSVYIPVHYWHAVFSVDGFSLLLADFFPSDRRRYHFPYPGLPVIARALIHRVRAHPLVKRTLGRLPSGRPQGGTMGV